MMKENNIKDYILFGFTNSSNVCSGFYRNNAFKMVL